VEQAGGGDEKGIANQGLEHLVGPVSAEEFISVEEKQSLPLYLHTTSIGSDVCTQLVPEKGTQPVVMVSSNEGQAGSRIPEAAQGKENLSIALWQHASILKPEVEDVAEKVKVFGTFNLLEKCPETAEFFPFRVGIPAAEMGVRKKENGFGTHATPCERED
jgi:hypothetical protein